MPTLTITLTDAQMAAVRRELARVNADRARHGQPAITAQDLVMAPIDAIFAWEKAEDLTVIQRALDDPAKAAAIRAAAGLA